MTLRDERARHWCPNCVYFYKEFGLNYCRLANWALHPLDGGDQAVLGWLKVHQPNDSTRIHSDADDCPGFRSHRQACPCGR